jgi:GntR family transcriptional regulator
VSTITDRSLWQDVFAGLRDAIKSGEYKPGDTLPSELDLAAEYGVSRDTVRRALGRLTQEGLLTSGRGRLGRQVRSNKPLTFYATTSESEQRVADQGRNAAQDISVAIEEVSHEVSTRLELAAGELVVVRRRIRTIDGAAHNLNDTYYPREIAEGTAIMHPADVAQGTIALMRDMGYVQVRYRDDLETRMPTPREAERLQIPPGVPVLVQYRTGYTTERPVKLTITVWPGDRTQLVYEFPA